SERVLHRTGDDSALSVQKKKRYHADEWRKRSWQRRDRAQRSTPGKLKSSEEKREWNSDRQGGDNRRERNDDTGRERFAIRRTGEKLPPMVESVLEAPR